MLPLADALCFRHAADETAVQRDIRRKRKGFNAGFAITLTAVGQNSHRRAVRQAAEHAARAGKHAAHAARQFHIGLIDQLVIQCPAVFADAHHPADLVRIRAVEAVRQFIGNLAKAHQRKYAFIALPRQFAAVGNRSIQIKNDQRRMADRAQIRAARLAFRHPRAFQPSIPLIQLFCHIFMKT